ncbi:MAG: glutamine-hydrolyzing carbamoyl-phosphate synthase small subunit [bacterium]|nr:glutamine-hydrolyzing carbamoyl-phosphate synthase small subunit [bacterium]
MSQHARLILEDGSCYDGTAFAGEGKCFGELVFNTAMSGYQEVLTDPSYSRQIVMMTYPMIGNYGVNLEDVESRGLFLSGFVVREYSNLPSNWRSTQSLSNYLNANNIIGIEGIDTRAVTRHIREKGAQRAMLTTSTASLESLVEEVRLSPSMAGQNCVSEVTCTKPYTWQAPNRTLYKVAVIDCGIKLTILRQLRAHGCDCHVFPADTSAETILAGQFDGVFLSNGPGDPEPVVTTVKTVEGLLGKLPIFGICLGHQMLSLALGGRTYKLKFGHHGINHPVKNLKTGHIEITSQNHGFAVDADSFGSGVDVTHINLYDGTNEGIASKNLNAFSVQYHPEAAPGPHDSAYLFKDFVTLMQDWRLQQGHAAERVVGQVI